MIKMLSVGIMIWLLLLTIFVVGYVIYDRKMQSIDLVLDNHRADLHEIFAKAIGRNERNIELVFEGHNEVLQYLTDMKENESQKID